MFYLFNTYHLYVKNISKHLANCSFLYFVLLIFQVWFQNRRSRLRRASLASSSVHHPVIKKDDVEHSRFQPSQVTDLSVIDRKRKTPCDIVEVDQLEPPFKKTIAVPPTFFVDFLSRSSRSTSDSTTTSSDRHNSDVIQPEYRTPRDSTHGAISRLMSVDFLSRSSRSPSPSTSMYNGEHLHRTPASFYTPMGYHPYVFYFTL